jgi:hypothetical protein
MLLWSGCDDGSPNAPAEMSGHALRFSGNVSLGGEPVEGATIWFEKHDKWKDRDYVLSETSTDSEGEYSLETTAVICDTGQALNSPSWLTSFVLYAEIRREETARYRSWHGDELYCVTQIQVRDFEFEDWPPQPSPSDDWR